MPSHQRGKGVYSLFCLIPKKDGSFKPILNLRPLNKYILSEHFHIVMFQDVIPLLQQGNFMTALNLGDAYFSHPDSPQKEVKTSLKAVSRKEMLLENCDVLWVMRFCIGRF